MNTQDEELQKSAERGESDANNIDARAYGEVFRIVKTDPGYKLADGFAERVVASVAARKSSRHAIDYFWFGAGIVALLGAFVGTVLYTGFRLDFPSLNITVPSFLYGVADYKGLLAFGVVFLVALNWLDKRLIRHRYMRNA